MSEQNDSCVKPARGPISSNLPNELRIQGDQKEDKQMLVKVGKPAIDFEASAYVKDGFKNIKLSDYKGKWLVICFYPGDFTFV